MLTSDDVKRIVRETVREELRQNAEKMDSVTVKTIAAILKGFGIDEKEEVEVREDFRYLRRWRKGADRVAGMTVTAFVTLVVGGLASALWLGIKSLMGKP